VWFQFELSKVNSFLRAHSISSVKYASHYFHRLLPGSRGMNRSAKDTGRCPTGSVLLCACEDSPTLDSFTFPPLDISSQCAAALNLIWLRLHLRCIDTSFLSHFLDPSETRDVSDANRLL